MLASLWVSLVWNPMPCHSLTEQGSEEKQRQGWTASSNGSQLQARRIMMGLDMSA